MIKEKKQLLFQTLQSVSDVMQIFNVPTIIYKGIKAEYRDSGILIQDVSTDNYQELNNAFIIDSIIEKITYEAKQRKAKKAKT